MALVWPNDKCEIASVFEHLNISISSQIFAERVWYMYNDSSSWVLYYDIITSIVIHFLIEIEMSKESDKMGLIFRLPQKTVFLDLGT